ncbi:MAG: LacI family DNA-binding transcriptional regulator [Actinomycetaceae bacterium]|nr:LacI family DNA-binding transcriptional regulator [Actinomycetaceae bacterium]
MSATQEDVARRAGVSRQLVSLVVRGDPRVSAERRRAVKAAMAELNYRPNAAARALAERRSGVIGVLVASIANPFFGNVVDYLRGPVAERGLTPLVAFGQEDPSVEAEAIDHFLQIGVAALVLVSPLLDPARVREAAEEVPVVVVARDPMGGKVDTVSSANRMGGLLACRHAIEADYDHIVYVGREKQVDGSVSMQRQIGYLDAMEEAGRRSEALTVLAGHHVGQTIEEVFDRVGSTNCCFIAVNDIIAVEIVAELGLRGIRPGSDVGVIGYDNTYLAGMHGLEITSIDQNYEATGAHIADLVHTRLADPSLAGRHRVIEPHLVKRKSSRRKPWGRPAH